MKTKLLALLLVIPATSGIASADMGVLPELGGKLVGGAIGYAIGATQEDKASWAPAAGAAAGVLVADWATGKWENKQNKDSLDTYMSGMNYQRWIMANKQWHTYTLDPHTGRPPAFAGLTEMNAGMGGNRGGASSNSKPENTGYNTQADRPSAVTQQVVQMPVVLPAGEHGGVNRSERTLYFPKLP